MPRSTERVASGTPLLQVRDVAVDFQTLEGPVHAVEAVDLDLDVVRRFDGSWFVDDEDEFELHRVHYDYPPELVAAAQAECARVAEEIRSGATRLAMSTAEPWFETFRAIQPS